MLAGYPVNTVQYPPKPGSQVLTIATFACRFKTSSRNFGFVAFLFNGGAFSFNAPSFLHEIALFLHEIASFLPDTGDFLLNYASFLHETGLLRLVVEDILPGEGVRKLVSGVQKSS
jgi:hypothetical protein